MMDDKFFDCDKLLHKERFPLCTACDDMIKTGENNLDDDNYKFDYDGIRIYLCEKCIPRFKRYDRGLFRSINYALFGDE
jgi:hypothetical protein